MQGVQKFFSHLDSALEKYTIRIASSRRKDCCMSRFLHLSKIFQKIFQKIFHLDTKKKNFFGTNWCAPIRFFKNLIKKRSSSGFIAQPYGFSVIFRLKIFKI